MKYRYFRNNPRAYDKLSPRAKEKRIHPLSLSLSVQQFDKATSVPASKEIKRDYWPVDWITAFSRGFPSFECKAPPHKFPRWSSILRRKSYEKLPERGRLEREGRGKTSVPLSCLPHPSLAPREGEDSSPSPPSSVKKSIYPPTRLYLQIESTFIQSSPPRWRRKRQRVGNERLRSYDRSD